MKKTNQTSGTLYIVSTSIGNKKDITIRATEVLQNCDIIVGEEMKEASRVLMHLNLSKPIELLNEHNEKEKVGELIDLIESGKSIALISDCGTPIFADPGIELLRAALTKEIDITVIPGSSSIMTAMVRSGFDLRRFFYAGFLHRNSKERIKEIQDLSNFPYTIVVIDTPYRLKVLLEDFSEVIPSRKAYIGMNLTMQSETHHYGTFSELFEKFQSTRTRNEYVLVIEGNLVGNVSAVQDTFEIDNELQINTTLPKDDKLAYLDEEDTFAIDDEDLDTNLEFENDEADERLELIEGDEDLILDDETDLDDETELKVIVEQKETRGSRNRDDNRRSEASNRDESDGRGSRRDDSRQSDRRSDDRRGGDRRSDDRRGGDRRGDDRRSDDRRGGDRRSDDRRSEGRREDSRDRFRRDDNRRSDDRRGDDRRGEGRREDSRDRYRRDDDRQSSSRRSDSNRGGNERRSDNFRDGYRKRNDEYRKDDRPRREEEGGGFRRSDDSRDSGRSRNDDFRRDDRRRGSDYGKDDRNKRDNFNKDNNRGSRGRFEERPRRQEDVGANQEKNFEEKRERTDRTDNFESRDRRERRSYDDRSPSRRSSSSDRGSNRGRRSEKSSKPERRPRRKKE